MSDTEFPNEGGGNRPVRRNGALLGPDARRVALLRAIADAGGVLNPRRNPACDYGYEFAGIETGADDDLKFLAQRDYLNERFFDRVSICPKCSSHHLNARKVCPSCRSTHIVNEPLMHHFRCGFVGRISEFGPAEGGKRICPKCAVQLRYIGTDHDVMGRTYLCHNCHASFQDPPSSAVCLTCNTETPEGDLLEQEIVGYAITSLGSAVLRRGTLFEHEAEFLFVADLQVYRPTVMLELLGHEARRAERYKHPFSLMLLNFPDTADPAHGQEIQTRFLGELRSRLRGTDFLGQFSDRLFVACLGETPLKAGQIARTRIMRQIEGQEVGLDIELAEVKGPADLRKVLEAAGVPA